MTMKPQNPPFGPAQTPAETYMKMIESHTWQPNNTHVLGVQQYEGLTTISIYDAENTRLIKVFLGPDAYNDAFLVFEDLAKIIQRHTQK